MLRSGCSSLKLRSNEMPSTSNWPDSRLCKGTRSPADKRSPLSGRSMKPMMRSRLKAGDVPLICAVPLLTRLRPRSPPILMKPDRPSDVLLIFCDERSELASNAPVSPKAKLLGDIRSIPAYCDGLIPANTCPPRIPAARRMTSVSVCGSSCRSSPSALSWLMGTSPSSSARNAPWVSGLMILPSASAKEVGEMATTLSNASSAVTSGSCWPSNIKGRAITAVVLRTWAGAGAGTGTGDMLCAPSLVAGLSTSICALARLGMPKAQPQARVVFKRFRIVLIRHCLVSLPVIIAPPACVVCGPAA